MPVNQVAQAPSPKEFTKDMFKMPLTHLKTF